MRGDLALFRGTALEDERLTRADLAILWHIGRCADFKTGWAKPSLRHLVTNTGKTKRTVLKAIRRLTECGYLACHHSQKPGKRPGSMMADVNQYIVLLDPPDAHRPSPLTEAEGGLLNGGIPEDTTPSEGGIPIPSEPYTRVVYDMPKEVYQGGIPLPSEESTRNTHRTPNRTPNPVEGSLVGGGSIPPPGNWQGEFSELLRVPIGYYEPGRIYKALKRPVQDVGVDRAREVIEAYAQFAPHLDRNGVPQPEINNPQFCTPERLAQTWAFWMAYTSPIVVASANGAH